MILEAAAISSRNESTSGPSTHIPRPLETSSWRNPSADGLAGFRTGNGREEAKPFLADRSRNHLLMEGGGWEEASAACPDGSETAPVRQLALRAIFGIDRELSEGEILERARALPGVLHLNRVPDHEVEGADCSRRFLAPMGFEGEAMKIVCGDRPVHFIREGKVLFLVQIAGAFVPGVRETLLIAARELDRG